MEDVSDVSAQVCSTRFEVKIPEEYVLKFMRRLIKNFGAADVYYIGTRYWRIRVNVDKGDEGRFHNFLQDFCADKDIMLHVTLLP